MNDLDTRLRESLTEHIDAVPAPPVDIASLAARGRRARALRRTGTGALAVGVAAAAVTLAFALPHGTTASSPGNAPDDTRGGLPIASGGAKGPASVPGPTGLFFTKQQVFLGGKVYDEKLSWENGAHIGRYGVAGPDPAGHPSLLDLQGKVHELAAAPKVAGGKFDAWVAADSDSGLVAWAEHTDTSVDVVAYDTHSMTELRRTTLPCEKADGITDCPRPYVADGGKVFIRVNGGSRIWDPATGELSSVLQGLPSQAHHRVLTAFEGYGVFPTAELGPGWSQAKMPKGIEGNLSYDGSWLLDSNGNPTVVNWRDPGQKIRYRPPGTVIAATFDTDGSVLVVTNDDNRFAGWDCELGGECKQVVKPQVEEIRLVAWDL